MIVGKPVGLGQVGLEPAKLRAPTGYRTPYDLTH